MNELKFTSEVSREELSSLPDTFGVYYFIDRSQNVIYVGKSVAIRRRVKSHFAAAKRNAKERKLETQTVKIAWQETAGELSALLVESHEIKRLQPFYNRRLRRQFKQYAWRLIEVDRGVKPELDQAQWPPYKHADGENLFGCFRSLSHARKELLSVIKRNKLCAKALGVEQSGKSCFAFQLNQCAGACVGIEPLSSHNQRVQEAFSQWRLADWPYTSLVGVIEHPAPDDVNLFYQWRYLGTHNRGLLDELDTSKEISNFAAAQTAYELDRDSYKILLSFLLKERNDIDVIDYAVGDFDAEPKMDSLALKSDHEGL